MGDDGEDDRPQRAEAEQEGQNRRAAVGEDGAEDTDGGENVAAHGAAPVTVIRSGAQTSCPYLRPSAMLARRRASNHVEARRLTKRTPTAGSLTLAHQRGFTARLARRLGGRAR